MGSNPKSGGKGKGASGATGAGKGKGSGMTSAKARAASKPVAKGAPAAEGKSKKGLVIGIVMLVVVIAAAAVAYNVLAPGAAPEALQTQGESATRNGESTGADASSDGSASDEKTEAPDIEMTSLDGAKVKLSDLRGKPVVLNFWASTCGPCKSEMPEFQSAYEEYGDRLQFVMLNVPDFNGETRERALQLVDQSGYTFPIYFDDDTQGQVQYGVTSIPQTYFINADGTVEAYASGAIDGTVLQRGIEMVLGA